MNLTTEMKRVRKKNSKMYLIAFNLPRGNKLATNKREMKKMQIQSKVILTLKHKRKESTLKVTLKSKKNVMTMMKK